jgi:hypothetical protein
VVLTVRGSSGEIVLVTSDDDILSTITCVFEGSIAAPPFMPSDTASTKEPSTMIHTNVSLLISVDPNHRIMFS